MKQRIVVINQKGGVGKSTTAQALGAGLAARGQRVLYVDLDAQGNLSDTLDVSGAAGRESGPTLLFVEHDAAFVRNVATRTITLGSAENLRPTG